MHGNHPQKRDASKTPHHSAHNTPTEPRYTLGPGHAFGPVPRVDWTTWWPWRGAYTRSHPELGRESPQRPWYCVLRHGRVGRRQVFQSTHIPPDQPVGRTPIPTTNAGWSSPVARQAHNLKVTGSNPVPATIQSIAPRNTRSGAFLVLEPSIAETSG